MALFFVQQQLLLHWTTVWVKVIRKSTALKFIACLRLEFIENNLLVKIFRRCQQLERYLVTRHDATSRPNLVDGSKENLPGQISCIRLRLRQMNLQSKIEGFQRKVD